MHARLTCTRMLNLHELAHENTKNAPSLSCASFVCKLGTHTRLTCMNLHTKHGKRARQVFCASFVHAHMLNLHETCTKTRKNARQVFCASFVCKFRVQVSCTHTCLTCITCTKHEKTRAPSLSCMQVSCASFVQVKHAHA
jgi:hypothetical protein